MKLFVYEHITSGAFSGQPLPDSLAQEGEQMLTAVVNDCKELADLSLIIMRDDRLRSIASDLNEANHYLLISNENEYQAYWSDCLDKADAVLIIAPETEDVLAKLQHQAINSGKTVFGCQPDAIEITTDKLLCNQQLQKNHIAVAHTCTAAHWLKQPFPTKHGYIIKPIDGAGCIDTLLFDNSEQLTLYLEQQSKNRLKDVLVQDYIEGVTVSLSLLFSDNDFVVLAINQQYLEQQSRQFRFTGCYVNSINSSLFSLDQAQQLVRKIQHTIPGLSGFVGIDLIIDKTSSTVIDINPRLTSSYIALKESIGMNPIQLMFTMQDQGIVALPMIKQRQAVKFSL